MPRFRWVPVILTLVGVGLPLLAAGCNDHVPIEFPPLPGVPQQGYVGTAVCAGCHGPNLQPDFAATYHDDWLGTAHGKTPNVDPDETNIVADRNDDGTTDFRDGLDLGTLAAFAAYDAAGVAPVLGFDAGSGAYSITVGPRTFAVAKLIGIGRHLQAYLTSIGGSLYVLPAVYDVEAATWRPLLPENWYTWNDGDSNGVIDDGETITGVVYATGGDTPVTAGRTADSWERSCAGCHATGITSLTRNGQGEFIIDFSEDGVTCEACHGPGAEHAATGGGAGLPNRGIVNPANLTANQHRDLCMSCHTRGTSVGTVGGANLDFGWRADGTSFLPGQALSDALVPGALAREPLHPLQGGSDHNGQQCQVCHNAHNTTNLALIRMTIDTPSSGPRSVVFTARGGTPGSGGLMGDATDGTFTDICEVCHTTTRYFRNDASTPDTSHNNGAICTECHLHSEGFSPGESGGGVSCDLCHSDLSDDMDTMSSLYKHLIANTDATYPTDASTRNCLSCHVDHDLFGAGARGTNLRTDIASVPATPAGASNTDFASTGAGGICLSCHASSQSKSSARPDGSTDTPPIPFDAAQAAQVGGYDDGAHNYLVASTFGGGGTFQANCSKCHNDDRSPKSDENAQVSANKFGLHTSATSRMIAALGYAGGANPLEEQFCYRCHSTQGAAVGGTGKPTAGRDWYDAAGMSSRAEDIFARFSTGAVHPIEFFSGRHAADEGQSPGWNIGGSRHVECEDCHNPHATGPSRSFDTTGTFAQPTSPSNLAANTPLENVWGVDVPMWPSAWSVPDPSTDYTRVERSTYGWQVCLKCHSGYAWDGASGGRSDVAQQFNPNNPSYHAVIGASKTTAPPNSSFVSPWTKDSLMTCSDCHTNSDKNGAQGPHGSAHGGILAGALDSTTGQTGTSNHLCFKCHDFNVYGRNGTADGSATGFSFSTVNWHTFHMAEDHSSGRAVTCTDCHSAVPHGWQRRALLVVSSDPAPYNSGDAALSASDVSGWPSSGNWLSSSCNNALCHD